MHETLATTRTSSRLTSALVQARRSRSISSIDRGVFLDVDVALGNVGLGLVIVVIADEVADRVLGKELLELGIELGGQRLVVRHHQSRPAVLGDHVGHGERLARAGDAHERLVGPALAQPIDQALDRLRLIAGRLKWTYKLECGHESSLWNGGRMRISCALLF